MDWDIEPRLDMSAYQSCIKNGIVWSDEVQDRRKLQSDSRSVPLILRALRA